MQYTSTSHKYTVGFREAIENVIPPDGGLYMPSPIPSVPQAVFNNIDEMKPMEIAYVVTSLFMDGSIELSKMRDIVTEVFSQTMPLRRMADGRYLFELFHGRTLAFKDISSKFLALMLSALRKPGDPVKHVLVSTTGNTGAAIANSFANLDGFEVHVLYSRGTLTRQQEAMLTGMQGNIHPVEVSGPIQKCKELIGRALSDPELTSRYSLITANSLNIGRLIPQIVCYYILYVQLHHAGLRFRNCRLVMPCGNLSNLAAGLIGSRMGATPGAYLAACNANNMLDRMLRNSDDTEIPAKKTLARALDLSKPSNLPRILDLGGGIEGLRTMISSDTVTDDEIRATIRRVWEESHYDIDPNTAVAYDAACKNPTDGLTDIIFATNHPAKSLDLMTPITGRAMELPLQLTRFMGKNGPVTKLAPTYPAFKKYLLNYIEP